MTNWHALPLELKTHILGAYVNCVVHDNSYEYYLEKRSSSISSSIVVEHWSKTPIPRTLGSFPKSDFVNLLLVAPKLENELLMLINTKLRGVAPLDERANVPASLYPIDGELYMMCFLKEQLAGTGNVRVGNTPLFRTYQHRQGHSVVNHLDIQVVARLIKVAVEEHGKL